MFLFQKILILYFLEILAISAPYPRFIKDGSAIYDGQLTDTIQEWSSEYANPQSDSFTKLKNSYASKITLALAADNATIYGDAKAAVSGFSGTWITGSKSGTIVSFVLSVPESIQVTDVQIDNDLDKGAKSLKYTWRDVDVHNADMPPLPKPDNSPGWREAANMFKQSINISVDPCQNFFNYACDNYIANHPIGDQPTQSAFEVLQDQVVTNLTIAFDNLKNSKAETSETMKMASSFYQACKAVTNTTYTGPELVLQIANEYGGWPLLDPQWNYAKVPNGIYWAIGDMYTKYGAATIYLQQVDIDAKNISRHIMYLGQANLAIPAAYYQSPNLTERYQNMLKTIMFQTAMSITQDIPPETLLPQIDRMVAIEYNLAMISVNTSQSRNLTSQYNPYTAAEAQQAFPALNWTSFLTGLVHNIYPKDDPATLLNPFNIAEPHRYSRDLDTILANANADPAEMRDLVNYIIFRLISNYMQFAGEEIHLLFLELRQECELDQVVITDREKQCVQIMAQGIPYATGRLYVDSSLPQINRDDVSVMINNVLSAFSPTLSGLQWMDNVSALKAFQKVAGLVRNVAYADWQMDDKQLDMYHQPLIDVIKVIDPKDPQVYFKYYKAVVVFMQQVTFLRLKRAPDRTDFGMSAAMVNAWYNALRNSITFPAAILNQPFYRYDFPQAVNYGGLGVVMGHELSHGFDDVGIQFDWDGALHTWMTQPAQKGFDKMAQCVVDEYSNFCYPGLACINGIATQGENIGDNSGLKAAYRAYQAYKASNGEELALPGLENFSMDQIFFLSFGQIWCGSYSNDALLRQLLTNEHSPVKDRVIGAVQNFPKFAEAFGCKKGDPMYPMQSCDVW